RELGKQKIPVFRGGAGCAHRFRIAHPPYHENIRCLTKGCAKGGGKIWRVSADLDLLDDAPNVGVLVLDGIFDGDDVAGFATVDVVDQCGECGRFPRTGGTADQYETS